MLIGLDDEIERAITSITGLLSGALTVWSPSVEHRVLRARGRLEFSAGHEPLAELNQTTPGPAVTPAEWMTVVVRNVQTLDRTAQDQLNDWLGACPDSVRTIATAPFPLYPLVERRELLESLYYRLNVVYVESASVSQPGSR